MAEKINVSSSLSREAKYEELLPQLEALVGSETDTIANMANISAALKEVFGFFWVGFYIVKDDQLVLGPFQGSVACTRINYGRGVCGTAWKEKRTVVVADVDAFPGHIACSSLSRSEIVVPLICDGRVMGVLDVDSRLLNDFDEIDARYLEKIARFLHF